METQSAGAGAQDRRRSWHGSGSGGCLGSTASLALLTLGILTGCASPQALVNNYQPFGMQAAAMRARADFNCVNLGATAVSRRVDRPVYPDGRTAPEPRVLFTVVVRGCDQQRTYDVVCNLDGLCLTTPVDVSARAGHSPPH